MLKVGASALLPEMLFTGICCYSFFSRVTKESRREEKRRKRAWAISFHRPRSCLNTQVHAALPCSLLVISSLGILPNIILFHIGEMSCHPSLSTEIVPGWVLRVGRDNTENHNPVLDTLHCLISNNPPWHGVRTRLSLMYYATSMAPETGNLERVKT